jgi:hypothetical protein
MVCHFKYTSHACVPLRNRDGERVPGLCPAEEPIFLVVSLFFYDRWYEVLNRNLTLQSFQGIVMGSVYRYFALLKNQFFWLYPYFFMKDGMKF